MTDRDYYTTQELAFRWEITPRTLIGWRKKKIGPPWYQLGPQVIRYPKAGVEAYEQQQMNNRTQGEVK